MTNNITRLRPKGEPHPVDALTAVRRQIKLLQDEEKQLRADILPLFSNPDVDRIVGDDAIAILRITSRKGSLDETLIKEALDVDDLDGFRKPATDVVAIKTEELS